MRTSVSAAEVVHGNGANHCLSSEGLVQAANTFSGGASMTQLSTRSRPSVAVVVLVVVMFFTPFLWVDRFVCDAIARSRSLSNVETGAPGRTHRCTQKKVSSLETSE